MVSAVIKNQPSNISVILSFRHMSEFWNETLQKNCFNNTATKKETTKPLKKLQNYKINYKTTRHMMLKTAISIGENTQTKSYSLQTQNVFSASWLVWTDADY